jgi:hypothetical protein
MSGIGSLFGGLFSKRNPAPAPQPEATPVHQGEESHSSHERPAKTRAEATKRYGEIKDGKWASQAKWMIMVPVPESLQKHWFVDGDPRTPARKIYCNKDIAEPLSHALQNIVARELVDQLKSFDGCFNIRNVRGSTNLSAHAYGLAIDINYETNQLGTKGDMTPELVACFTDEGFAWGGNFKSRKDPMHYSFCWE